MMAALLAVSALSGCGKDKGGSGDTAASGGTENEEGGAEKQYRVALVVNQKFGDKASMDDLAKGADKAAEDFGVEIAKLESAEASRFEEDVTAQIERAFPVEFRVPYIIQGRISVIDRLENSCILGIREFL